jgi:hypothetical protein
MLEKMRELPCASCGADDGTIVGAHRNESKGMGMKVSDALVAALCFQCHTNLDQGKTMNRQERREFWNQAYIKTMQYMIENNILRLK